MIFHAPWNPQRQNVQPTSPCRTNLWLTTYLPCPSRYNLFRPTRKCTWWAAYTAHTRTANTIQTLRHYQSIPHTKNQAWKKKKTKTNCGRTMTMTSTFPPVLFLLFFCQGFLFSCRRAGANTHCIAWQLNGKEHQDLVHELVPSMQTQPFTAVGRIAGCR